MASAGAGVWVDLELGERQEWEEEEPNPPSAQIGFIDSSIYGLFNLLESGDVWTRGIRGRCLGRPWAFSGRGWRVPPPLRRSNGRRPKFVSREISLYPLSLCSPSRQSIDGLLP